jgi:hypothetical protein
MLIILSKHRFKHSRYVSSALQPKMKHFLFFNMKKNSELQKYKDLPTGRAIPFLGQNLIGPKRYSTLKLIAQVR